MKTITVHAVEWKGQIVALFRDPLDASDFANARVGATVHGWVIPAETFEFEGN